ncbi:MAG: Xaa-Pro peptidase family protein [Planctomycetota bacterium]
MNQDRLSRLMENLPSLGCDALLVTDEINVTYLTGFTGDSSSLLVRGDGAVMLTDGRYEEQLHQECPGLPLVVKTPAQRPLDTFAETIGAAGEKRIAIEAGAMTVATFTALKGVLPAMEWISTEGAVEELRMIKDADEIETLRRAVQINQRALQSVLAQLSGGWTEREITLELERAIRRLGGTGFSFEPIIGAGPGGAKPHYESADVVIGDHASLLVDWGTKLGGYASDLTRTFHFGSPPDRFESAYQAVLDSQLAGIEAIRPGATGREVDAASRNVLKQAGLEDYFIHGLGHGVGLRIHESPRLSSVSDDVLQPGMVITVEPGVYFAGEFGIRLEDDVLVTESGHEVLSDFPKGLDDCRVIL